MSLNKTTLKTAMLAAINQAYISSQDPENSNAEIRSQYAEDVADAIDAYVRSIQITIQPGVVQVTGSASAQTNPAPIILEGPAID